MTKHKTYSADFKTQVVLEALQGEKTAAQICREYSIAPDLLTHWKQNAIERLPQLFSTRQQHSEEQERIAELERLVGQLTLELTASKKVFKLLPSRLHKGEPSGRRVFGHPLMQNSRAGSQHVLLPPARGRDAGVAQRD